MRIITPNKEAIKMGQAMPIILVLSKFTIIPKNIVNTYAYMNEVYLNTLN